MQFHFGIFEPPAGIPADKSSQKPFFTDLDRTRKAEVDQAVLTGRLPASAAELRPLGEYATAWWPEASVRK